MSQSLRIRSMQFLTNIAKRDSRIHALILKELNFKELLKVNMFEHGQEATIPITAELLKCFQNESGFLKELYSLLINYVQQLPNEVIGYRGYEALIGMLKWAYPLDTDQTLTVVVDTLCKQVIEKIAGS